MAGKWKAKCQFIGVVLGIATVAGGDPSVPEGTAALAEFLRKVPFEDGGRVVGMTGFHAGPRPQNWLMLVEAASAEGSFREFVFDGATVLANRRGAGPAPGGGASFRAPPAPDPRGRRRARLDAQVARSCAFRSRNGLCLRKDRRDSTAIVADGSRERAGQGVRPVILSGSPEAINQRIARSAFSPRS
jgi:hypothetical protein